MRNFNSSSSHRRNNFDALRLFLSLAVIFGHSFELLGHADREPLHRLSRGSTYFGSLAVAGFFIISGFLISKSWTALPQLRPYLRKRVLRIFPGYAAAVAVCILIIVPLSAGRWVPIAPGLVRQGLVMGTLISFDAFQKNIFPYSLNGSLWTIRYEFYCYLLIAGMGVLGLLCRRWPTLVLAIGSMVLLGFAKQIPPIWNNHQVGEFGGLK